MGHYNSEMGPGIGANGERPTAQEWAEERARELHCNHAVGVEKHQAKNCAGCRIIAAALIEVEARGSIQRDGAWLAGDVTAQTLIEQARAEGREVGLEDAERDFSILMAAIVAGAGGRLVVGESQIVEADPTRLICTIDTFGNRTYEIRALRGKL